MSNVHGFDFLRSEHTLPADATAFNQAPSVPSASSLKPTSPTKHQPPTAPRSDLEKQFDVLKFLNTHRQSGCLPPHVISSATGVHLDPTSSKYDAVVATFLEGNPKVRIENVPDPSNPTLLLPTYGYQAKFSGVVDRQTLLAQINRCPYGISNRDLIDSYEGVDDDVMTLLTAGDVIAVQNPEDKDRILFPRGEQFLVELDGVVTLGKSERESRELSKAVKELHGLREETQRVNEERKRRKQLEQEKMEKEKQEKEKQEKDEKMAEGDDGKNKEEEGKEEHKAEPKVETDSTGSPTKELPSEQNLAQRLAIAISKTQEWRSRLDQSSHLINSDIDPLSQIRRGEAISVGGSWFRVSSAISDLPLSEQPPRARAPPSVTMFKDLSKKNELGEGYYRPFTDKVVPLDRALPREATTRLKQARAARERLHKIAATVKGGGGRGVSGGATSQLLSSHASAANPDTLASAFVSSFKSGIGGGSGMAGGRKRPGVGRIVRPGAGVVRGGNNSSGPSTKAGSGAVAASSAASDGSPSPKKQKTVAELVQDAREAAADPALTYAHARRHGCTKDVREMFLATRDDVPQSEVDLYNLMIQHKLIDPGEPMRRPRMKLKNANLDNDGKPKKRRYYERKNQRQTNTHLMGTAIGAVLARAQEMQQQGKEVGDGGM